jgi:hypothetical protein
LFVGLLVARVLALGTRPAVAQSAVDGKNVTVVEIGH